MSAGLSSASGGDRPCFAVCVSAQIWAAATVSRCCWCRRALDSWLASRALCTFVPTSTPESMWDLFHDKVLGGHLNKPSCLQKGLNPASSGLTFIFSSRIDVFRAQLNWRKLTLTLTLVYREMGVGADGVQRACAGWGMVDICRMFTRAGGVPLGAEMQILAAGSTEKAWGIWAGQCHYLLLSFGSSKSFCLVGQIILERSEDTKNKDSSKVRKFMRLNKIWRYFLF